VKLCCNVTEELGLYDAVFLEVRADFATDVVTGIYLTLTRIF
jgi:hypothetical protein